VSTSGFVFIFTDTDNYLGHPKTQNFEGIMLIISYLS